MGLFIGAPGGVLLSRDIPRTIIGAEAFHGPVRDGKAWDHLAMAARQTLKLFAFNNWKKSSGSRLFVLSWQAAMTLYWVLGGIN